MDDLLERQRSCPSGHYRLSDDICQKCSTYSLETLTKFANALEVPKTYDLDEESPNYKDILCQLIADRINNLRKRVNYQKMKSQFDRIPEDVMTMMMSNLETEEILKLCQTNRSFRDFCNSRQFWIKLWNIRYPNVKHPFSSSRNADYLRRQFLSYDINIRPKAKVVVVPFQERPVVNWQNPTSDPNFFTMDEIDDMQLLPGDLIVLSPILNFYVDVDGDNNTTFTAFQNFLPSVAFKKVMTLFETRYSKLSSEDVDIFSFWSYDRILSNQTFNVDFSFVAIPVEEAQKYGNILPIDDRNLLHTNVVTLLGKDEEIWFYEPLTNRSDITITLIDLLSSKTNNPMYDLLNFLQNNVFNQLPDTTRIMMMEDPNLTRSFFFVMLPLFTVDQISYWINRNLPLPEILVESQDVKINQYLHLQRNVINTNMTEWFKNNPYYYKNWSWYNFL